jgi:hypothetical protein
MNQSIWEFLQSASNAVAGNVAGPVDLLGMGLNKIGVNVGNAPVGGSEWMKRKGLMRDVEQGPARVLGETAGLLGPAMVTQFAPQIAGGLLKGADNLAAPRTLNPQTGAVVWHGSPHKFDKFDSSKIGTGEGAQAYGHGLYLAESPDVASEYQRKLGGVKLTIGGVDADEIIKKGGSDGWAAQRLKNDFLSDSVSTSSQVTSPKFIKETENYYRDAGDVRVKDLLEKYGTISTEKPGSLYKVDLPDEHIAKMLDWDKPLSQQTSEVRKAVLATKNQLTPDDIDNLGGSAGVRALYDPANKIDNFLGTWQSLRGRSDSGEMLLKQQGIPGIRYLDGGSRGAGSGTSNYVVFPGNEGLLKILERNGRTLE